MMITSGEGEWEGQRVKGVKEKVTEGDGASGGKRTIVHTHVVL